MKTLFKTFIILSALSLIGCKTENVTMYKDDPRLNFWHNDYSVLGDLYNQKDSVNHIFYQIGDHIKRDTVHVTVVIMGLSATYDREFEVRQSNVGRAGAAVADKHYVALDKVASQMIVKAGSTTGTVPVILLRDSSLEDMKARLELEIVPNKNFKSGNDALQRFVVTTTDMLVEPGLWADLWYYYFGSWGPEKMKFLMDYVLGRKFNWEVKPSDPTEMRQNIVVARRELEKYNEARGPDDRNWLREKDGSLVTF